MVCVQCGAETKVVNSRLQRRSNQVWRRRQCLHCGATFTTEERTAYAAAWLVEDALGHLQPFSRDTLFLSLFRSLKHRKTAQTDAGALAETVIKKLVGQTKDGRLTSRHIQQVAQVALQRFDKVASLHYQAFHD